MTIEIGAREHRAGDDTRDTVDLSKIKLTLLQLVVFVAAIVGMVATSAVSLYQLGEVRKSQVLEVARQVVIEARLGALETDKARREGIEYGQAHPPTPGR